MTATASVAAAFERIIADAPEQWWAVFFDLAGPRGGTRGPELSVRGTAGVSHNGDAEPADDGSR